MNTDEKNCTERIGMKGLDYEITSTNDGRFYVWTPDSSGGGIVGYGNSADEAIDVAISNLQSLAKELTVLKGIREHELQHRNPNRS